MTITADVLVALEIEHRAAKFVERLSVQRIEHLRPVDRDDRDGAVALEEKVVKGHRDLELYPTHSRPTAAAPAPIVSATTSAASTFRGGTNN